MATLDQLCLAQDIIKETIRIRKEVVAAEATDGYLERLQSILDRLGDDANTGLKALGLDDPEEVRVILEVLIKTVHRHREEPQEEKTNAKMREIFDSEAEKVGVAMLAEAAIAERR